MSFIGQSAPYISKKAQSLNRVSGMNPSQVIDIAFKVYNAQEAKKIKQAMVILETGLQDHRRRQDTKGERRGPLSIKKCVYCKEEGHWRKECLKQKGK